MVRPFSFFRPFRLSGRLVVIVAMIVTATIWSVASCINAGVNDAPSDDLAHAWQTVWNVGHGHGFSHTHIPSEQNLSRLATHADFLLILLSPLSWIWPNYQVLLVFQAVVVAGGAWFLFVIARRQLKNDKTATGIAIAYLTAGMVAFPVWFQFHAVTLCLTFILALIEAIISHRRWWVVATWVALSLLTKEQVGFILGPLIALVAWSVHRRAVAVWLGVISVCYSVVLYALVLPAFPIPSNPDYLWRFYYASLGSSAQEILPRLLQPAELWTRLIEPRTVESALTLLLPLAFLPLVSPMTLLAGVALAPHWLSDPNSVNLSYQHNHVLAVPILWYASVRVIQGWQGRPWWPKRRKILAGVGVALTLLSYGIFSPYPWSLAGSSGAWRRNSELKALQRLNRTIPEEAVVGYSWGIPPIFRNRQTAYLLPHHLDQVDYAVIHTPASSLLRNYAKSYYQDLFDYFAKSTAFSVVYSSPTSMAYRRLPGKQPEAVPTDFYDPTPAGRGR